MMALRNHSSRASIARVFGLVMVCLAAAFAMAGPASAEFGISTYTSEFQNPFKGPVFQAGSHADMTTFLHFNTTTDSNGHTINDGQVRDIQVDLPAGFYGNPQAMPACVMQELVVTDGTCNPAAQVGVLNYEVNAGLFLDYPVYNLKAPNSQTAVLGVVAISIPAKIVVSVRSEGDFGLRAQLSNINQGLSLTTTRLTLWGIPADPIHDVDRFFPNGGLFGKGAPAGVAPRPFLSMPARCEPVTSTLRADSWQNPGVWHSASATTPPLTGCDKLKFDASIKSRPQLTAAGMPTGYDVSVSIPQDESVKGLATPQLRKAVVALPAGTKVSPASADGLGACSDVDLKLGTDAEPSCPDSSKVGTVSIDTPVLKDPVAGDIILGTQRPDQLLRLWFVVRGPGLLLKIPGKVDPDPVTGQLVATFDGTPQLPFTSLNTSFKGGSRAALSNPKACGTYTTHATLTPWSGGPPVEAEDSFTIDQNCDQAGKFEPALDAGVLDPKAGGSSPFVFNLSRPSGQQDIASLETTLPAGLVGRVGDVPQCPEPQAAAGTCSAASQVGSVRSLAGAGPAPLAVPQPGKASTAVFLAGPYKGAPFSLSIVVPAQAGPFDLGTVVVRAGLYVDPVTAQVTVKSDPLPTILMGIPLDIQKITVVMDRPGFMLNPTNCDPMAITADVHSDAGTSVHVQNGFQATNCAALDLKPKLGLMLSGKGQTTDGKHPAVTADLVQKPGQANLRKVKVTLPLSLALDPDNANGLCEFVDGSKVEPTCPKPSIVGTATAISPILYQPLTGPVYFVKNIRKDPKSGRDIRTLPKLVIPLTGENGVRLNLTGTSNVEDNHLVTTFDQIPDAPVSSFKLNIIGGKGGILVVSGDKADICKATQIADQKIDGQNGKTADADISIKTPACSTKIINKKVTKKSVVLKVAGLSTGKLTVTGRGIKKTTKAITTATVATITAKRTKGTPGKTTASLDPAGPAKARAATK